MSFHIRISSQIAGLLRGRGFEDRQITMGNWLAKAQMFLEQNGTSLQIPSPWGTLQAPSPWTVLPQISDIFVKQNYACEFASPPKRIVDCGGNVGLSAIWFALHFPSASVDVYEADPNLAKALVYNCQQVQECSSVRVHAAAVSTFNGVIRFQSDGDDKGKISNQGLEVPCVDIADVISGHVDLLKMDIEGAEFSCFDRLFASGNLGIPLRIVAELHVDNGEAGLVARVLSQLSEVGFKTSLRGEFAQWTGASNCESPFANVGRNRMFLHLYAWR